MDGTLTQISTLHINNPVLINRWKEVNMFDFSVLVLPKMVFFMQKVKAKASFKRPQHLVC